MAVTWQKLAFDGEVIRHDLATAVNDFLVASGAGAYVNKTLAETRTILSLPALNYAVGDLLYASSTSALSKLADVAVGSVLVSGGVGAAPAWSAAPTLTSLKTTGTISVLGTAISSPYGVYGKVDYSDPVSGTSMIYMEGVANYTGAESVGESVYGLRLGIYPIVNAGHTNTGSFIGAIRLASLRNFSAADSDDGGTLTSLYGIYIQYGHNNIHADETPQTTSVYGLFLAPYYRTGTIGTMYDIYIGAGTGGGTVTTSWSYYQANTKANYFGGNIHLGIAALGTSAAKVLGIGSGTAPTTSPANMAQMWVTDRGGVAGKAGFHIRNEDGANGPIAISGQDFLINQVFN